MSSWSGSGYPPPRRSRSRSPYRGGGGGEWDAYERDRWNYERDRAAYDYGRRGRSRSPGDDARKRRRSPSPYDRDRDRFDPRPRYADDYDAHSRGYGYGSSPPRRSYSASTRRAPPDPHTFDYPSSLKQYAEWFRYYYPQQAAEEDNADKAAEQDAGDGSRPRNGIRTRWEKYKKEFSANQLQSMFEHHKKSPWFAEKYDPSPEYVNLRKRVRKEGWKGRLNAFLFDLESGRFDPDFQEHIPAEAPPSPVKENATVKKDEASKKEEKEVKPEDADSDMAPAAPVADDSMKMDDEVNLGNDDEGDENDGGKSNGRARQDGREKNRGEEISVHSEGHQVMIRTIPPDIGRVKLETVGALDRLPGYVYLALGDPLQKRNYYRAGWLKFREDTDMTAVMSELNDKKIDGFKLHVLHNTHPFKNRVRHAPEVASKPDRLEKDLVNAKALAHILEEEYYELRKTRIPPFVPPKEKTDTEGAGENGEANAEPPSPSQDVAMPDVNGEVEEDPEDPEPKMRGTEAVEKRIEKVIQELQESGTVDVNDEVEFGIKKTTIALDLYLAYLRAAFHACYYCAIVTDHLEELQRKCIMHARKPLTKAMKEEIMKATTAGDAGKVNDVKDEDTKEEEVKQEEDKEGEQNGGEKAEKDDQERDKDSKRDVTLKERTGDVSRDWRRNDDRWLDWLDSKVALLIDRNGVDPRAYGGKSYDEALSKAVEPHIKQEDEGKYRCKECGKLFKATAFVEKHIANKHGEVIKDLDLDINYFNNFALDPHHIQPFTHPPSATNAGGNQAPPPQAYGHQAVPGSHPSDYGRGNAPSVPGGGYYSSYYPPPPPPPYANGGYWDPYAYPYGPPSYAMPPPPRRGDEGVHHRRLSDRISGYAPGYDGHSHGHSSMDIGLPSTLPPSAGLPAKPAGLDQALPDDGGRRNGRKRGQGGGGGAGGGGRGSDVGGVMPPPPPDAKEDPRAAAGKKVSYHDMDLVAEGDVELQY